MLWSSRNRRETYVAEADVLDQLRVNSALADDLLKNLEDNAIEVSVLEATLSSLGQRSAGGESNDNIIGILRGAVKSMSVTELGAKRGEAEGGERPTLCRGGSCQE